MLTHGGPPVITHEPQVTIVGALTADHVTHRCHGWVSSDSWCIVRVARRRRDREVAEELGQYNPG